MTRADRQRLIRRYAAPQRGHLAALVASSAVPAALIALQPLALKLLVDNGVGGRPVTGVPERVLGWLVTSPDAKTIVLIAAVATVLFSVASVVVTDCITLYWEWVGGRMVRDAARDLFDKLQRLSPLYHARVSSGDALSLVTTDASAVYTATSAALVAPLMAVMTLGAVGLTAWRLDRGLLMIALGVAPVSAGASRWLSGRLKQRASSARREQVTVTAFVHDIVHALPLVQASNAERQNDETFRSMSRRSLVAKRRTVAAEAWGESVTAVIGSVGIAAVLLAGGAAVLGGTGTVGGLIVFVSYVRTMEGQFRVLLRSGRQVRLADVGLERLDQVLQREIGVSDPTRPMRLPPAPHGSSITFDQVTFGYDRDRPVLHELTLTIEPGETIAIVGPTGAGKSTMAALLLRLFDPWSGRVVVDGVDLRHASVGHVRRRTSLVRQDPLILPASVTDNIAIGRPGASGEEVRSAARAALADELIERLPDGYDTVLVNNGSMLSGGQRQRLALARAFLKEAPILVLDEPTSALDADSESYVVEAVRRVSAGRTVLVIAHRLATVRAADRVVVLDGGRIAEVGTPEELLRERGLYAVLHDLQRSGSAP